MNLQEIDRLVAEKVMGWKLRKYIEDDCYITDEWVTDIQDKFNNSVIVIDVDKFNPSTDIRDAWQVVEKLIDKNYDVDIYNLGEGFIVQISFDEGDKTSWFHGEADFASMAICLAALKAVGVDVE